MQIILIMQIAAESRKLNFYREPCYWQISYGLMFYALDIRVATVNEICHARVNSSRDVSRS